MNPSIGQIELAISMVAKEIALRDVAAEDETYREDQYIPEHFAESTISEQKEAMRTLIAAGYAYLEMKGATQDGQGKDYPRAS